MASAPLPKPARAAVFVAFLIAFVSGLSVSSGPIVLLLICAVALFAAIGILLRRVWSAFGFALLLALSVVAILAFAITGNSAGSFFQTLVTTLLYGGLAGLFVLAGLSLKIQGARQGSPIPWIFIALLLSAPFIILRPLNVTNGSMENTLLIGDSLLVDRFSRNPAIGNIVAFHDPVAQRDSVARVVGLPDNRTKKYSVKGDAPDSAAELVDSSAIIGEPKLIYDSLAPDAADVNPQKQLSQPTHPLVRRWDRIFKTL